MVHGFNLHIEGWLDGERVERRLEAPDRWQVHAAERVVVTLPSGKAVTLIQQPGALSARRVGVGACLWDGALVLAAYIDHHLGQALAGARLVELGAGVGLVGLAAAAHGAHAVLSDRGPVLPLLRRNAEVNGYAAPAGGQAAVPKRQGSVAVKELEWGPEGYMDTVRDLAQQGVDFVVAADCCYIDQDGQSPSTEHFVEACAGLCSQQSARCLVSFEVRSEAVRATFLSAAARRFGAVQLVPREALPDGFRLEYVELYKLTGLRA